MTFNNSGLTKIPSDLSSLSNKLTYIDFSGNKSLSDISLMGSFVTRDKDSGAITKSTSLRTLLLNNTGVGLYNASDNSNNATIFNDLYDGGLRTLNLTSTGFYKGQLDSVVSKYGNGLTVDYIN